MSILANTAIPGQRLQPPHPRLARSARQTYLKSVDFPIHLMVYWWLFWIVMSVSPFDEFIAPSNASVAQFLLLIFSFYAGHLAMKRWYPANPRATTAPGRGLRVGAPRVRWALVFPLAVSFCALLLCLRLAGAFDTGFVEYFLQIRNLFAAGGVPTLTGVRTLDVLTKILFFPISYTAMLVLLAIDLSAFRYLFMLSIVNVLCFAYLWQVNYPFIHLFWLMVFYTLVNAQRRGVFSKKILVVACLLFAGLVASAANRFGGDVLGGVQRYIVDYHLVGFSYYDQQYLAKDSVLHNLTYGRSSLGFLDQTMEAFLKPMHLGYQSASLQSQGFNETAIDIGASESLSFNAFGTILFSFYRDFNIVGILLGGFLYGAAATYARYRSAQSWRAGALFFMLATAWMVGMMVSPLEEVYFWFAIVSVGFLGIINRGLRW